MVFLCPNASSKPPKHPNRKETMSAHLEIPLHTFQDNPKTADRLRNNYVYPALLCNAGQRTWVSERATEVLYSEL